MNPYMEENFYKLNTSYLYPEVIVNDSENIFKVGSEQYQEFVKTRFVECTEDVISSKLKKNSMKLPKDAADVQIESPCIKITESMLIKIRDACTHRPEVVKECFTSEISGVPECFMDKSKTEPYHNVKSTILYCILKKEFSEVGETVVNGSIIDLSLIIRSKISTIPKDKTFNELCSSILQSCADVGFKYNVDRIDLVADQYNPKSIKSPTRSIRKGKSINPEVDFDGNTKVPNDVGKNFINNEANKRKLNSLIALTCKNSDWSWKKDFAVTNNMINIFTKQGEKSIYRPDYIEVLEEADNRIVCHISDMLSSKMSRICVRTGYSDIIVILL